MRHHHLLWTSSYDRGLDILLYLWADIKKEVPTAKLFIAYGWNLFDIVSQNNPERQEWKRGVELLMQQEDIYHLGRIGKEELKKIRQHCGILAYPSYFLEINCLSIIEAAKEGVVPVSVDIGAVKETLNHGIFVKGDIRKKETQEEYKKTLIGLMKNKKEWERLSYHCQKEAKKYEIKKIAQKWVDVFNEPTEDIKVSIITPTIREGFWNSMAQNISEQTYKNLEWIIVDDYWQDRSKIAQKYAKKYNLDIKYIRGDKAKGVYKRKLGLIRANNLGWKASSGELLVWLQDFIYMDEDAIESIVDLYRHNKDCLIAPVDIYYEPINVDKSNKEDWFNGQEFIGKKAWKNIRVKYQGIRESENPFDFELNFGAIPKHILDKLNGFWEFFDEGLGFDNTDICYRAIKSGYRLLIDDSIIAKCLNLWQVIKGSSLNVSGRERLLNPPRWVWAKKQIEEGKLPIVRDERLDEKIDLFYEIPKEIKDEECAKWIENHTDEIVKSWEEVMKYGQTKTERKKRQSNG